MDVAGAVSISTPFAGSWTADWARFFVPTYQLFRDVGRRSIPIKESQNIKLTVDWTQIVSTKGNVPYHRGKNDGVCTIKSMKSRKDMELIEVPHTHFEVMCSDLVVKIILGRYQKVLRRKKIWNSIINPSLIYDMKNLVISRKGFDSTTGGRASPIFETGEIFSVPIPQKKQSPFRYRDLQFNGLVGQEILN